MKKDTDNTIAHMYLVPHFHYDVAWIHTEEEEEKRGASLVKQFCDKARSDPQFKFILDPVPLLQAFMRQYPEEVSYLRQLIDGGRCELSGGLYVQPEENLVHGESLVRQVFYGQKWLVETFGRKAKALGGWNIDSFGHTMQLPQVLSKGGIKYVVFARPGAGDCSNLDFEHSEFNWSSPDGSVIFTHEMPSYFCVGDKIGRQRQDNDETINESRGDKPSGRYNSSTEYIEPY